MRNSKALAIFLAICAAQAAGAQSMITGVIVDGQGNPVAGYPVVVESSQSVASGMSNTVGVTAADGQFSIMVSEPGQYEVVLPTQPDAKHAFEVPQNAQGQGIFSAFGKQQAPSQMAIGNIQLKN